MLNNQFKFSVILCGVLLLASCGGGGSDITTTLPTANDSNVTPDNNATTAPVNPNEKVVTQENVDIEDAKIVEESIESIVATQMVDSLDATDNTQGKYRLTYEQTHSCQYGGSINISANTDETTGDLGSTASILAYTNCYITQEFWLNGTIQHTVSIDDLGLSSIVQTYVTDFTINTVDDAVKILQDSSVELRITNGYDTVGLLDGDAQLLGIYNFNMMHGDMTTIVKDLTIKSRYEDIFGGRFYTCLNEGAIYTSIAPNANPFLIDESFDANCEKEFVYSLKEEKFLSGRVQFYIGNQKFQTYADTFDGELHTCRLPISEMECTGDDEVQ